MLIVKVQGDGKSVCSVSAVLTVCVRMCVLSEVWCQHQVLSRALSVKSVPTLNHCLSPESNVVFLVVNLLANHPSVPVPMYRCVSVSVNRC